MPKSLTAIMICILVGATSVSAAKHHKSAKSTTPDREAVSHGMVADETEMSYAAIKRTNPFDAVPAVELAIPVQEKNLSAENQKMLDDMISYAKRFIGTRYVRGGKSPKGFDCSGFTSYVFEQFGFSLNRSSAAQYSQGEKIEREEISTGDLLFFTGRNSRNRRVGHVGIALENNPETGEITFIHAATSGGIRIDRISAPYYSRRYLGARRILDM